MRAPGRVRALARVVGATLLASASLAVVAAPASAAAGTPATGEATLTCQLSGFVNRPFDYPIEVEISGYRAAEGDPVTLTADLNDMPGLSPAPIQNYQMDVTLDLEVEGAAVTLTGGGKPTAAANAPVPVPTMTGEIDSDASDLEIKVKKFTFNFPILTLRADCPADLALSTLTVGDETPPPTTAPTTAPPTTAPTTAVPTTPAPTSKEGEPATGTVNFACTLSLGSKFEYPAEMSVSGYRAKDGDPVALQATMSDLPGMSPVPINGSMDFTLGLTVGGTATTLKATSTVDAAAKAEVKVPTLTGSVKASGDELDVSGKSFTFDFPSAGIGAECTGDGELSKLVVGDEAPEDGDDPPGGGGGGGGDTGGEQLPKTGGTDALPVIALVASALLMMGAAGLVLVPARRRTVSGG
ncbi:hypothetical protein [Mumia sp. Pv 4-285]|uniref:hypothetical protein n=1 Tax=Mumia qirimensis TaxID=3234852 RepID=UPI00351CF6CF